MPALFFMPLILPQAFPNLWDVALMSQARKFTRFHKALIGREGVCSAFGPCWLSSVAEMGGMTRH